MRFDIEVSTFFMNFFSYYSVKSLVFYYFFFLPPLAQGFEEVGMIEKKGKKWPDIFKLFNTYRGSYEDTELANYRDFFKVFYEPMSSTGHISEGLYDRHMIPVDRDSGGNMVEKYFGVKSEHRQRAKVLSNPDQMADRTRLLKEAMKKRYESAKELYDKQVRVYEINELVEKELVEHIKTRLPDGHECTLSHATRDDFAKINAVKLRTFVKARRVLLANGTYERKLLMGNKEKAVDIAFGERENPVLRSTVVEPLRPSFMTADAEREP